MSPAEPSPRARAFEHATLWIVVGLFLALSISWAVYPRLYDHYHPTPPWPGEPESFGPSNAQLSFSLAILLAVLGFLQLGILRWLQRDTSRFLSRVFLLLGLGLALDYWTFAIATRFWTLTIEMQSDQAHRAYEMSRMLARYFLKPIIAIGLLNIGISVLRKRGSRPVPG
jgi:hypothetical protein